VHESVPVGPTGPGAVALELGADIGALILVTPPELAGHEIEISPAAGGPRTHSLVRERSTASGTSFAAVYPALPAADYAIYRPDGTTAGQVSIQGGQATRHHWPVPPSALNRDTPV
jgi:hypothetical protein